MAGFSAWTIEFSRAPDGAGAGQPLASTAQEFAMLFGVDRRCPW
jgi:hypothetical protein